MRRLLCSFILLLVPALPVEAGIHCSQEILAELPAQWRGFLLDQRLLRLAAVPPRGEQPINPVRQRYLREVEALQKAIGDKPPTPDQAADLGALHLRLGDTARALEILAPAQRAHPEHFRLTANLATTLHAAGELNRAREMLRDAVRLAPEKLRPVEQLHLRLVEVRLRAPATATGLDDLFGVRYQADGAYKPGHLDPAERKKLPADAVARVQSLALVLPYDARLLWQLAELAGAHGDVINAAAMMDGCVGEFNWADATLREHRRAMRAAADELLKAGQGREAHVGHHKIEMRSSRPLLSRIDLVPPPPIDPRGVNPLTWTVVGDTIVDRRLQPTFPKRLRDLDGLEVTLTGYMQPLGDEVDCAAFLLIEFPIGCWLCEMPGLTGLVMIDMPAGKTQAFTRDAVRITGKLKLNHNDPESFLYLIAEARVKAEE